MHKAVQSTFRDKSGNVFELQFQTPSSQAAKELKLPLSEERRGRFGLCKKPPHPLNPGHETQPPGNRIRLHSAELRKN